MHDLIYKHKFIMSNMLNIYWIDRYNINNEFIIKIKLYYLYTCIRENVLIL